MLLRRDCHWTSAMYVQELVCFVPHKIRVACIETGGEGWYQSRRIATRRRVPCIDFVTLLHQMLSLALKW